MTLLWTLALLACGIRQVETRHELARRSGEPFPPARPEWTQPTSPLPVTVQPPSCPTGRPDPADLARLGPGTLVWMAPHALPDGSWFLGGWQWLFTTPETQP